MTEITRLLEAAKAGDRKAASDLLPLVYDELRKLAAVRMAGEAAGHTLDATGLVHEAYLRLVGNQQFDGCGHFFAPAAETMRRVLFEAARRKKLPQPGGGTKWKKPPRAFEPPAAETMRRVLVEAARRKKLPKHGGGSN